MISWYSLFCNSRFHLFLFNSWIRVNSLCVILFEFKKVDSFCWVLFSIFVRWVLLFKFWWTILSSCLWFGTIPNIRLCFWRSRSTGIGWLINYFSLNLIFYSNFLSYMSFSESQADDLSWLSLSGSNEESSRAAFVLNFILSF